MKKIFFIIILSNFIINAQEKSVIKYDFQDKNGYTCNSSLYIINNESIYKIEDTRSDGVQAENTAEGRFIVVMNDSISKVIYSNNEQSIVRIPLYKNEILYYATNSYKFEFTGKTKTFEKYNCQEAKLLLNGRKYSIWFTPDIEINYGPLKINGLPGLVVEVFEETNKTKITLRSIEKLAETKEFDKLKKYILSRPILEYKAYEESLISIMCRYKAKKIAKVRELGGEIEYNENQESFTTNLIDIPVNLVTELKKIN